MVDPRVPLCAALAAAAGGFLAAECVCAEHDSSVGWPTPEPCSAHTHSAAWNLPTGVAMHELRAGSRIARSLGVARSNQVKKCNGEVISIALLDV